MDQLIVPNWHPILVHFTVALSVTAAVFLLLSKFWAGKGEALAAAGKWTLWAAAVATVLTLLAGFAAFGSVAHDDVAHRVMKVHRLWALVAAGALFLTAFWAWRARTVSAALVAASVGVAGLVGATGYLGAELVYRHGLGVMRLPDTSGAGHTYADGGHEHGPAEATKDHKPDEGHDHDKAAEAAHEHGDGQGHDATDATVPADPAAVADALKAALKAGDADAVDALLADDVLILEGGHAQTSKAEYMGGHMKSDMAFLPHIETELLAREVGRSADVAWVVSHTRSTGSYRDKPVDRTSREFLLLRRQGENWKIALVEWADR